MQRTYVDCRTKTPAIIITAGTPGTVFDVADRQTDKPVGDWFAR